VWERLGSIASAGEYIQLPGVIHVHSSFSSGQYSIGELVSRAGNKGLEVLILTDHDQVVMEYGLFPFRNLIKRRETVGSAGRAGELSGRNRALEPPAIIGFDYSGRSILALLLLDGKSFRSRANCP